MGGSEYVNFHGQLENTEMREWKRERKWEGMPKTEVNISQALRGSRVAKLIQLYVVTSSIEYP